LLIDSPFNFPHRHASPASYYTGSSERSYSYSDDSKDQEPSKRFYHIPIREESFDESQWSTEELENLKIFVDMMGKNTYQDRYMVRLFMRMFPQSMHSRESVENAIQWVKRLHQAHPLLSLKTWKQEQLKELFHFLEKTPQPFDIETLAKEFHAEHPELNMSSIVKHIHYYFNYDSPDVWSPEEDEALRVFAKFTIQTTPQATLSSIADLYKEVNQSPKNRDVILSKLQEIFKM
jgi:hypothetical protein